MTTKNCANRPKLVLKDLCEKSFVGNVPYSPALMFCQEEVCLSGMFFAQVAIADANLLKYYLTITALLLL